MQRPIRIRNMKIKNLIPKAVRLKELISHPIYQFGFSPLIFFAGPTFVVTYYSVDSFKTGSKDLLSANIVTFLDVHVVLVLCVTLLISYFVSNFESILNRLSDNGDKVNYEGLLHLKEALEKIVQFKSDRFELESKNLLLTQPSSADIFKAITKPDQQIAHIAHALHGFLESITDNVKFKVRIIQADENGKPSDWYTYAPSNLKPSTSIAILQHSDSSASTCLRMKKMLVIEDIQKAANKSGGRQYVMAHSDPEDEVGSLICYPICLKQLEYHPLVLAISTDKPYFKKNKKDLYRWILDQFVLRIQLEYSLVLLKEKSQHA